MTTALVLLTLVVFAVAGGVGYLVWHKVHENQSQLLATRPSPRPADWKPRDSDPGGAVYVDPVIAPPPWVPSATGQKDSVRDWLKHHTRDPHLSWDGVVEKFYQRALRDPEIAGYFHGVDRRALQRHFTAAIIILTSDGLKARTDIRMMEVHRTVRDRRGRPITGEVYDKTVGILVKVLEDAGVPTPAIADLAKTIEPLRRAIVVEPAA